MSPALQLCQAIHLQRSQPTLLAEGNRVLLLPSYIAAVLSGDAVCDTNLAAMSGLYSMQQNDWWPTALKSCGISSGALPELVEVGKVAGATAEHAADLGLPAGIPIVMAGNDQTAGAYGAGVHEDDSVLITLGTCQVAYRAPARAPEVGRSVAAGPFPGGEWYAMAADICGGNLINWAQTVLSECGTDDSFFAAAASAPPGCDGLSFGIGEDGNDNAWRHVKTGHRSTDMARAVVETLVKRMVGLVEALCPEGKPDKFLVGGGGSRSELWTELLSEALGRPLVLTPADPLAGAARMAFNEIGQ